MKQLAKAFDGQGDPIANNFVRKGGDVNSSMQSHDRSGVPLGEEYDSNASASFIAFNEFRSTNKILTDTVNGNEEVKKEEERDDAIKQMQMSNMLPAFDQINSNKEHDDE